MMMEKDGQKKKKKQKLTCDYLRNDVINLMKMIKLLFLN